MRRSLTVGSHAEGDALVRALDDPTTRAFCVVVGLLQPLSDGARARVLQHVQSMLDDPDSSLGQPRAVPVRDEDLDADLRLRHLAAAGRSAE